MQASDLRRFSNKKKTQNPISKIEIHIIFSEFQSWILDIGPWDLHLVPCTLHLVPCLLLSLIKSRYNNQRRSGITGFTDYVPRKNIIDL